MVKYLVLGQHLGEYQNTQKKVASGDRVAGNTNDKKLTFKMAIEATVHRNNNKDCKFVFLFSFNFFLQYGKTKMVSNERNKN